MRPHEASGGATTVPRGLSWPRDSRAARRQGPDEGLSCGSATSKFTTAAWDSVALRAHPGLPTARERTSSVARAPGGLARGGGGDRRAIGQRAEGAGPLQLPMRQGDQALPSRQPEANDEPPPGDGTGGTFGGASWKVVGA